MDKERLYIVNSPSKLYHALDKVLRKIVSEHVKIKRDFLHVIIFGFVDTCDDNNDELSFSVKLEKIYDGIIDKRVLTVDEAGEFGDVYTGLLDYVYDEILRKFINEGGLKRLFEIQDFFSYVGMYNDDYREVYIGEIKNILNGVLGGYMFEMMCDKMYNRIMDELQVKFLEMKRHKLWLNGFGWEMMRVFHEGNECIEIGFKDRIAGSDVCRIVFDRNKSGVRIVWI